MNLNEFNRNRIEIFTVRCCTYSCTMTASAIVISIFFYYCKVFETSVFQKVIKLKIYAIKPVKEYVKYIKNPKTKHLIIIFFFLGITHPERNASNAPTVDYSFHLTNSYFILTASVLVTSMYSRTQLTSTLGDATWNSVEALP